VGVRSYVTLDGLRGVAALCIVGLHAHRYFGDPLPTAQIVVDLFFVLSGFVLAHAYGPRFREGMTAMQFMRARYARLYPLYILGIGLGTIEAILAIHYREGSIDWTWWDLGHSLAFNVWMIPTPFGRTLFPLDGVMWSIFLELVVNLIWVLAWRRLESTRVLVGVILVSGVFLFASSLWYGTAALGQTWSTFPGGVIRVTYSFFLGVLLYRYHRALSVPRIPPLVLMGALITLVALPLSQVAQILCALFVLPLFVLAGSSKRQPGGRVAVLCVNLGLASYAVYALHKRLYELSYAVLYKIFDFRAEAYIPWAGFVFTVLLVFGCIFLARRYDPPARRRINRWLERWLGEDSREARRLNPPTPSR
jgi:peptidoglycan/LPS O-acetylase OafA/YrhL